MDIAAENARILDLALKRIAAPVPGSAMAFLADALARHAANDTPSREADGARELIIERDAEEAERFRIECERDAAIGIDDA